MPLPTPILDDRSWQQLRDELVRRIPVYTPEWTDHNASDPGITLLELFAFLGENLLFRFNQVPEATRLEFLRLLQVPLRPAQPARALLELTAAAPVLVPHRHGGEGGERELRDGGRGEGAAGDGAGLRQAVQRGARRARTRASTPTRPCRRAGWPSARRPRTTPPPRCRRTPPSPASRRWTSAPRWTASSGSRCWRDRRWTRRTFPRSRAGAEPGLRPRSADPVHRRRGGVPGRGRGGGHGRGGVGGELPRAARHRAGLPAAGGGGRHHARTLPAGRSCACACRTT